MAISGMNVALACTTDDVVRGRTSGYIGAGEVGQSVDEVSSGVAGGQVAAVDQQIGLGEEAGRPAVDGLGADEQGGQILRLAAELQLGIATV